MDYLSIAESEGIIEHEVSCDSCGDKGKDEALYKVQDCSYDIMCHSCLIYMVSEDVENGEIKLEKEYEAENE